MCVLERSTFRLKPATGPDFSVADVANDAGGPRSMLVKRKILQGHARSILVEVLPYGYRVDPML